MRVRPFCFSALPVRSRQPEPRLMPEPRHSLPAFPLNCLQILSSHVAGCPEQNQQMSTAALVLLTAPRAARAASNPTTPAHLDAGEASDDARRGLVVKFGL